VANPKSLYTPEPLRAGYVLVAGVLALAPALLLSISYVVWWQLADWTENGPSSATQWLDMGTVVVCGAVCPLIAIGAGLWLLSSVNHHRRGIILTTVGAALFFFALGLSPL